VRSSGALFQGRSALLDTDAALEACSAPAAISVGPSLAPRAKAQAFRFPC
jgi:hypothetical protein